MSKCHTVIDYDVYLPDSLTIADLDYRASASNGLARTASISALCANATMRFVCSEAFRRCTYGTVNPNLPQGKTKHTLFEIAIFLETKKVPFANYSSFTIFNLL